jgi:hypothetical protein
VLVELEELRNRVRLAVCHLDVCELSFGEGGLYRAAACPSRERPSTAGRKHIEQDRGIRGRDGADLSTYRLALGVAQAVKRPQLRRGPRPASHALPA